MSSLSTNHIAKAIYDAAKDKSGAEQQAVLKSAVQFLAKKKMLDRTGNILRALEDIASREEKSLFVRVQSAEKLRDHRRSELGHALKEIYGREKIHWHESEDKTLLHGVRVEVGDDVIDLSAKSKLKQLKEHLIK